MHGDSLSLLRRQKQRERHLHRRLFELLLQIQPSALGSPLSLLAHLQDEEKHGLLLFLGSVLCNALLCPNPSSLVSSIQTIHKQLQRLVLVESCSENRCLTPELLYNLGVLSMDCPIHPITIPLVVNELFALFQDEDLRLRSYACRFSAMLFSELVGSAKEGDAQIARSMHRATYRKTTYLEATESTQTKTESPSEPEYVFNPSDYSFESVVKIFVAKMNSVAEERELLCFGQTMLYVLFGAKDHILERDVTILVNVLFEFLRRALCERR